MQQVVLFVKHKEEEKVKSKISGMQFAVILGVGGGGDSTMQLIYQTSALLEEISQQGIPLWHSIVLQL